MKNTTLRKLREPAMIKFLVDWLLKCDVCKYDKHPRTTFYEYDNETIFDLCEDSNNQNNSYFCVHYDKVWSVFNTKFRLNYVDTQQLIKDVVEDTLKIGSITPSPSILQSLNWWKTP